MKCNAWISTTIGEQLVLQRGYDISKAEQVEGEVPVISSSGIKSFHNQSKVKGPGVLLGRKGTIGTVYYTESDYWPHSTTLYVKDFRNNNPRFVYYFFQSIKEQLKNMDVGTSNPTLNRNHVHPLNVMWPCVEIQNTIETVLSAFDAKIELNNKITSNLQQQAQAIFKSWFVDFEPFQDGEFVESELGPIPKGWSVGRLANICTYGKDKVAVSELTPENYFSTENMLANKGGYTSAASLPNVLQTTRCVPGDTLVSNIRPYFKKIVYCTMNAGCSTDVLCLRPKHLQYSTYLYNVAYSDTFFDYMVAGSKGTKMPRGDKQQIMSYPVILPPDEVIAQFHEFADAVLKKIWVALEESKRLTVLRDGLLPKLMSGELSLNEEVGS